MSAIEKLKRVHPPWHSGDAYLRKGKIGRVHAYSARGGVSLCEVNFWTEMRFLEI